VVAELTDEQRRAREEELDRELSRGERELPENQVKGLLGERNPSLEKVDDFAPDLNAGISQENDSPVEWLVIILAYLIFFPVGYFLLWRSPHYSRRSKVFWSVVGAAGIAFIVYQAMHR
jgi:hypothetical protein